MKKLIVIAFTLFMLSCGRKTTQVELPSMNTGAPDTLMLRSRDLIGG